MMKNIKDLKFRCSSVSEICSQKGKITDNQLLKIDELQSKKEEKGKLTDKQEETLKELIEKRDKKPELPQGVQSKLIERYTEFFQDRYDSFDTKETKKGNDCEEDAATLLTMLTGVFYKKNEQRWENELLSGKFDFADNLKKPKEVIDTKIKYKVKNFNIVKYGTEPVPKLYRYQIQAYMALTGATKGKIAYCLVNSTPQIIDDEKRSVSYKYGAMYPDDIADKKIREQFRKELIDVEKNHIYDIKQFTEMYPYYDLEIDLADWVYDIAKEERIHIIEFDRDEEIIKEIYESCKIGKEWIQENIIKKCSSLSIATLKNEAGV